MNTFEVLYVVKLAERKKKTSFEPQNEEVPRREVNLLASCLNDTNKRSRDINKRGKKFKFIRNKMRNASCNRRV